MCCQKITKEEVIHPIPTPALLTQMKNKETHLVLVTNITILLSCAEPSTTVNILPSSKGIPTMKASSLLAMIAPTK